MNITELDQYNLKDAVKFHARLNPRLWGRDEHLLPEVTQKLLAIAADFQEFLGVPDLDVVDITVSGSNAAYSYTPNSDIDLHLVVRMPDSNAEVYQELFNAKKYQYNDEHDIRIGGADVELYVQPAGQKHHSQGIYSVRDGAWQQVPSRRKARIDDTCVRHKSEDLSVRIEQAIASDDEAVMQRILDKIKRMRQAGLEQQGEFGCDNLVFKVLRQGGYIDRLRKAKTAAHDRALSLQERKKKKKTVRYGFGGYWYPGFAFGSESGEGADGGGESVREGHQGQPYSSEDGVAASTQMFLNETDHDQFIEEFIKYTADRLGIESMPRVELHKDDDWAVANHSFGRYDPESHSLHVNLSGRHIMDVLRTTAHELAHCRQHEIAPLPDTAGDTGSPWENEAHAVAGEIMRDWADQHPEMFDIDSLKESASGYIPKNRKEAAMPQYAMALSVDIQPGEVGRQANKLALNTGRNGEPTLLMKSVNLREGRIRDLNDPPGPESPPTMPQGTVRVDVSDMYDWYKLGQHISNMKGLGRHDFGKGPPSTIFSFGDEDLEHQYIDALKKTGLTTTDIDPLDPKQPPDMPRQKTDPTYNVAEGKMAELDMDLEDPEISDREFEKIYGMTRREARELFSRTNVWDFPDFRDPDRPLHEQGVAEDNNSKILLKVNDQDSTVDVTAILDRQEVGHVNFDNSRGELIPQDLYVDPEYRGQGIAAAMYDYTKSKGYTILRGEEQSDDAVGFWAKHRPGKKVWEQGVAEGKVIHTYLWHGSRQKIPMLEPRQAVDTGGAAGSNQNAIYATSDPIFAIQMGMPAAGSDYGHFPNDPQMVLFSGKIRKGEYVYLHKLPFNGPDGKPQFVQGGNSREFHSIPGVQGIKPIEIKEIPVNRYLNLIRKATPADWKLRKKYMKKQGVKEDQTPVNFGDSVEYDGLIMTMLEGDDGFKLEAASPQGRVLGFVEFWYDTDGTLHPEQLEVDERYRGQGIAKSMYDFVKGQGFKIARSAEQTDAGRAFWNKNRPGQRIWEQNHDDLVESLRQEFELLEDEFIGEIRMSPSNLRAEAAKTGALAGMEFEMIVPGVEESEAEPEPDFDQDERCRSISDAVDFFHDGEYNGRRDVERLATSMQEDYYEWLAEKIDEDFTKDSTEYIYQYLVNNVSQEEIGDIIGEDLSDADVVTKQQAATAAERVDEDEIQPYFDDAKDWHKEEYGDSWDESDWLDATDLDTMQSIYNAYDIAWPHWNFDTGSSVDIDSVAQDFGNAVGMPVNASSSYHGARREPGKYVVEPDGSLEPNNRVIVGADGKHYKTYLNQSGRSEEDKQFLNRWQGRMKKQDPDYVDQDYRVVEYNLKKETGLEFVSPPLPIDQLFDDLKKVQAWAKKNKITTNYSTGLHINVSVPEFSRDKLDYVKLALLLGDEYVLDQFGRSSNTYARSALEKVRELVRDNPQTARALLDRMRGHMEDLATKAIHSGDTSKYTSINTKDGYIEFRSPGGDWLDENFDKVENTLLRFTVALKAAMDPEAYREEYLKKLYRLLEPTTEKDSSDTVRYFADYVAGKIPQTALRSFVKQARLKRDIARGTVQNQLYWWRVYKDGKNSPNSATVEVVASSKDQAIDKAGIEWNIFSAENRNRMDAEPVRPYVEPAASISDEPQAPDTVTDIPPRQTDYENMLGMASQAADANWEIVDRSNYQPIFLFIANTAQDAMRVHERWLQAMGYAQDSEDYGFRERARPGSTLDIQRRRAAQSAQAAVQSATQSQGNNRLWQIVNSADGEVAYEFYLSRENNQQDANEVGLRWVRNNGDPNTSYSVRAQPQQTGTVRPQDQQGNTQWRILINGQEIHRFWNRANQGEANGVAQTWVLDQIRRGLLRPEEGAEVEVVPVTGSQT